ncbi:protein PRRC2C-like isoform X2 [Rhopilema esculentum]
MTKKDVRASKRHSQPLHGKKAGKIRWLDESHKIFKDNQGDIVTSIHNQRSAKRDQKALKRTPTSTKGRTGKVKWLDGSKKIFKDSQNDIVTSLHQQRGVKKSNKQKTDDIKLQSVDKRSKIKRPFAKENRERTTSTSSAGKFRKPNKLWKKQNILMPSNDAHRFLGQTSVNENSEIELLDLAPKKSKFLQSANHNDENVVAMEVMKEATDNPKIENSNSENAEKVSNGLSFRKPMPYMPLQATAGEHEPAEYRSEASDNKNEAALNEENQGKNEKSEKEKNGNSKGEDGKGKEKDAEKEKIEEKIKEKEKEVEKEKEKERQQELEFKIEKEKERMIEEKLREEQVKNAEKERELEMLKQEKELGGNMGQGEGAKM